MTWIRTVPPDEASGPLKDVYAAIASARGGVAAVHQVQSLNPRAMRAHLDLYKAVVFARSSLGRVCRERIAVVVSAVNRCAYCVAHHGEALRRLGEDPLLVESLARGELRDRLPERDRALLRWARLVALRPADCTEAPLLELRALGYDDEAILHAALTASYFCFVNRLALALGVRIEADHAATCGEGADST